MKFVHKEKTYATVQLVIKKNINREVFNETTVITVIITII